MQKRDSFNISIWLPCERKNIEIIKRPPIALDIATPVLANRKRLMEFLLVTGAVRSVSAVLLAARCELVQLIALRREPEPLVKYQF